MHIIQTIISPSYNSGFMYNHSDIETKWQKYWSEHDTFASLNPELESNHKPKFYALDMFPYPSGAGLHVGHPK